MDFPEMLGLEMSLSRNSHNTLQLEWALAFLSICLTEDMVCRLRYCSPDCAVGEIWEMCNMWDVWNIELAPFMGYFSGGKNWEFFLFSL